MNFDQIIKESIRMQAATQHIPRMVAEEMEKSWKQLPNADASRSPKSWQNDPLALQYSLGYKDRRFALTYQTLKRISGQLSIISAIINTRSAQVAAFSQPYRWTKSLGFVIKHKDPDHATTPAEVEFIKELEQFIINCGRAEPNPHSLYPRDDFDAFLRKIVRDSLIYDQCTFEVVPDNIGLPYEFVAVDASTIRIASDDRYVGVNSSNHSRSGFVPSAPSRFASLYPNAQYGSTPKTNEGNPVAYVQVINGQIENVYDQKEIAFGIRNPRTDIYVQGYGFGELEQLITIVTSHLYAEEYNRKFFSQGSAPKGLMNLKGDNYTPETLEGFRRSWNAMASGVENAWKTPIFQSEGLEWIDLARSNQEMEFGQWIEYLIKVSCGVFLIDPAEINFDVHGGQQNQPLFESSNEWKLKASRDRGLKPLLKFLAKLLNRNIIDRIDDHFTLEFVGLDELSEQEKHEMLVEQISSYMTLNEARKSLDLPPVEHGDIPMNPVYLQAMQGAQDQVQQQQAQQQEQAAQAQQQEADQTAATAEADQAALPAGPQGMATTPQYTDHLQFAGQGEETPQ